MTQILRLGATSLANDSAWRSHHASVVLLRAILDAAFLGLVGTGIVVLLHLPIGLGSPNFYLEYGLYGTITGAVFLYLREKGLSVGRRMRHGPGSAHR